MKLDMQAERERELINQISLVFEHGGLPPISGRIVGRLLLCDPAHQSSTELADYLNASRGAISTQTRMLIQAGILERVRFPGDRSSYFRIVGGCWSQMLQSEFIRVRRLRMLGDEALKFLTEIGADSQRSRRAQEFRDFSVFFENEFPALFEHWENRSKS